MKLLHVVAFSPKMVMGVIIQKTDCMDGERNPVSLAENDGFKKHCLLLTELSRKIDEYFICQTSGQWRFPDQKNK